MICPKCGANMTLKKGTCSKCGYDIEINQKTRKLSCYFYNQGLAKAKVRDLSGAAEMLRRSLKIYKKNIDARNLLGLVYYEMGEVVMALHAWIVSRNLMEDNNPADKYLQILQANPAKLDNLNGAIRKYNAALEVAKDGGIDLAVIQLKRALQLHPKFIRAWQLLALLYMADGEYEQARRCLRKVLAIDIANTTAICYMKELRRLNAKGTEALGAVQEAEAAESEEKDEPKIRGIVPRFGYQDDRPDYRVFIGVLVGLLLGVMVVFFMVVPGVKAEMRNEFKKTQAGHGEELSGYLSDIDSLEKENQTLQKKIELLELELETSKDELEELRLEVGGVNMFRLIQYYLQLERKTNASRMELYLLQKRLEAVSENELESREASEIYEYIAGVYPDVWNITMTSTDLFEHGLLLYEDKKYSQALEYFQYSYEKSPDNERNLYYLGRTYHLLEKKDMALQFYNEYMERFPTGQYFETVEEFSTKLRQ